MAKIILLTHSLTLGRAEHPMAVAGHPAAQHRGAALPRRGRRLLEPPHARLAQEICLQTSKEEFW